MCGEHGNVGNSNINPEVVCAAILVKDKRISVNAQNKGAIDQAHAHTARVRDLLSDVADFYSSLDEDRCFVGPHLFNYGKEVNCLGRKLVANKCNLDPLSDLQPVLYGITLLIDKLGLSYQEITSLHLASVYVNEQKVYFGMACELYAHGASTTRP